jgi:hypothetical protein
MTGTARARGSCDLQAKVQPRQRARHRAPQQRARRRWRLDVHCARFGRRLTTDQLELTLMRTLLVFLGTFVVTGCSSVAGARATQRADVVVPAVDSLPTGFIEVATAADDTLPIEPGDRDLSGSWITGSTDEPTVRSIMSRPQCTHSPGFWSVEQRGDTVKAWTIPESHAQGIASPILQRPRPVEGRLVGRQLVMSDGSTHFRLRYDSASGHLRGTLNGAPFWAVRLQIVRPQGCLPVP